MDKRLEQKINEKIQEALATLDEIEHIAEMMDDQKGKDKSFQYGIVVGRLYNSFYYQSRRILGRSPTEEEFTEFLEILSHSKDAIQSRL
ncbi:MAG: hypothetical protein QXW91_01855 [Candidatus Nitrosotenuis sp.]